MNRVHLSSLQKRSGASGGPSPGFAQSPSPAGSGAIPRGPGEPPCALLCSGWPEKQIYNPDEPGVRAEAYLGEYEESMGHSPRGGARLRGRLVLPGPDAGSRFERIPILRRGRLWRLGWLSRYLGNPEHVGLGLRLGHRRPELRWV